MTNTGQPTDGGHGLHMRAINQVRALGSIEKAVKAGLIKSGIMHALVTNQFRTCSPGHSGRRTSAGVYSNSLETQDAMRELTVLATGAILVASALHAIAVGTCSRPITPITAEAPLRS